MTSSNEALKKRVEAILDMAVTTVSSLSEAFSSGAPVASEDTTLTREKDGAEKLGKMEQSQDTDVEVETTSGDEVQVETVSGDEAQVESNGSQV